MQVRLNSSRSIGDNTVVFLKRGPVYDLPCLDDLCIVTAAI